MANTLRSIVLIVFAVFVQLCEKFLRDGYDNSRHTVCLSHYKMVVKFLMLVFLQATFLNQGSLWPLRELRWRDSEAVSGTLLILTQDFYGRHRAGRSRSLLRPLPHRDYKLLGSEREMILIRLVS